MSGGRTDELGCAGERLAEAHLKAAGLKLIARRFNTPVGEIDLLFRDRRKTRDSRQTDTLVFVEVKTRRDRVFADPEDAVGGVKQRRLLRAARWYLHEKGWEDRPCRFDVVTVILPAEGEPEVRHIIDAFVPDER